MPTHLNTPSPTMEGPAIYRINVLGRLGQEWSERLAGMNITYDRRTPDGDEVTILVGRLPDQAALAGVLSSLYELHLPVTSLECLESR